MEARGCTVAAPRENLQTERLAVAAVPIASARLRALAKLSGSMTDAMGPGEAARLVEQEALTVLGATGAVVVTLGRFPPPPGASRGELSKLHLIHAIGVPEEIQAAVRELPLDAAIPFAAVARSGEPLFLASVDELKESGEWGAAMLRAGAQACAVVPVWANGELRGVLGLSWPVPQLFDEDDCAFVLTLGVMCAQAILRAYLRQSEVDAREAAEAANRSKANFLTMISHELRTPMNALMGYGDIIAQGMDGPLTARQSDHLAKMKASSTHLLQLIEELLGYARLEAGQDVVNPEPVQLLEAVESTVAFIRPLAEAKGLSLRIEQPQSPVELYTDVRKLRQVLLNLLANAVKYTESGEVALVVQVETQPEPIRVIFEISDTGQGMSPNTQARIFDPFWQNDANALRSTGTGLGLPIARRLARLLGGDVALLRAAERGGSTFLFTLPLHYEKTP